MIHTLIVRPWRYGNDAFRAECACGWHSDNWYPTPDGRVPIEHAQHMAETGVS